MSLDLYSPSAPAFRMDAYEEFTYGLPLFHQPRELNPLGKLIAWLKEEHPLAVKIASLVFVAFSALALCLTIIGIPLFFWAWREWNLQDIEKVQKNRFQALFPLILETRFALVEALGGSAAYQRLPTLDIGRNTGIGGYIDFLQPSMLTSPLMKGADCYGRPFIACKLRERATGNLFVLTLFQRYLDQPYWVWVSPVNVLQTTNAMALDRASLATLRQIFSNTHLQYAIAE